jgi:hypothetical protein
MATQEERMLLQRANKIARQRGNYRERRQALLDSFPHLRQRKVSLHLAGMSCATLDRWHHDDDTARGATDVFERLAFPSALQLRRAVLAQEKMRAARVPRPPDYQPWRISIKDAREFVAKAGQRQIPARTQPFDGKIASGPLDARWAADIVSYVVQPAKVSGATMQ